MPVQYPRGRTPFVIAGQSRRGRFGRGRFRSLKFFGTFSISGVTRDSAGAALAGCTVHLFSTATDTELAETVSDGSGAYSFSLGGNAGFYYCTAYKPGSPDVAGITLNTLVAT